MGRWDGYVARLAREKGLVVKEVVEDELSKVLSGEGKPKKSGANGPKFNQKQGPKGSIGKHGGKKRGSA
jgi:ethanolamine utilization protein EutQ (cupin superfamily)